MGLLDKALVLDNHNLTGKVSDIRNRIVALQSNTTGLDFPTVLFTSLIDLLGIGKGALLLPGEEHVFVPWSETGFDQTTSRRIRIPQQIVENLQNSKSFDFITLTGSEIEIMGDFFSFREYSVTESILISPLFSEKNLVALLFVSEGVILSETSAKQREVLELLSNEAGPLLLTKRESIFNKLDGIYGEEKNKERALSDFIEKYNDSGFLLLSVQFNNFINFIMTKESNSISFRIKQDIFRLVKTLISTKGEVINGSNNSIIILLGSSRIEEAELFVHQIGISLSFFYKISSNQCNPDYIIKKYPEDGSSPAELIKSLFP